MKEDPVKPPVLAITFLKWFCPYHLYEEIEGDLLQNFIAICRPTTPSGLTIIE